ncbi:MAG: HAL/PAL/TAL family ammonia-lyase, partial [Candidatus Limnocylindrales bacterium]
MSDTPRSLDPSTVGLGSHRHLPESQRLRQPLPAQAEIVLTGADLSIADVEAVARAGQRVRLGDDARSRMTEARDVVERLVAAGEIVYGVTTGFGDLATTFIDPADSARLQENLLVSHAVGVGDPLPRDVVRAMLLLRANTLALGHSGCRPVVVDRICDLLRLGIHPVVPSQGSVGASGDLAPLAHLALPLTGRGPVEVGGQILDASDALESAALEPLVLQAKEGLALLNGTQAMHAVGGLALLRAKRLSRIADVAGAMSLEALKGTPAAFDSRLQDARPHPGQKAVAKHLLSLMEGSEIRESHLEKDSRVQ